MARELWLFPGMGTDSRVFFPLMEALEGKTPLKIRAFDWIEPLSAGESLAAYAQRFKKQLPQTEGKPYILGLSLGAMLAAQLCQEGLEYERFIILSSANLSSELPWYFPYLRRVPIYRLIPKFWTVRFLPWAAKQSKIVQNPEYLSLFVDMLKAQSPLHFAWGRGVAIQWENKQRLSHCHQIHGSKDHIFPAKKSHADKIVPNANHALVLNQVDILAEYILGIIPQDEK